jgi:hypothetical protein
MSVWYKTRFFISSREWGFLFRSDEWVLGDGLSSGTWGGGDKLDWCTGSPCPTSTTSTDRLLLSSPASAWPLSSASMRTHVVTSASKCCSWFSCRAFGISEWPSSIVARTQDGFPGAEIRMKRKTGSNWSDQLVVTTWPERSMTCIFVRQILWSTEVWHMTWSDSHSTYPYQWAVSYWLHAPSASYFASSWSN